MMLFALLRRSGDRLEGPDISALRIFIHLFKSGLCVRFELSAPFPPGFSWTTTVGLGMALGSEGPR